MPRVIYINSPSEIVSEQKHVLVIYGEEYAETSHVTGLTITVARQHSKAVSELSFLTAVRTAKKIAKQEGISDIFVCTAPAPDSTIALQQAINTSPAQS